MLSEPTRRAPGARGRVHAAASHGHGHADIVSLHRGRRGLKMPRRRGKVAAQKSRKSSPDLYCPIRGVAGYVVFQAQRSNINELSAVATRDTNAASQPELGLGTDQGPTFPEVHGEEISHLQEICLASSAAVAVGRSGGPGPINEIKAEDSHRGGTRFDSPAIPLPTGMP